MAEERTEETTIELAHKTKIIHFLGRTTPIVLQNDNGPCPLLAICNVLLLKNNLNLSSDVAEVSQEKLLSLVAERLIDSNSNLDDKDAGFVENQEQNIADAIDLLPRLATGIDVNIKFTRIDDFEFTPECAIFDLLDIPLYHGWIVDPQDSDTANAIGLKSYNTLMGELVALETRNMECDQKENIEEDSVDFVAATTAALGVPSPSLSRGMSFEESPKKTFMSFEESPKKTCTSFEESPKKTCMFFEESPKSTCGEDIEKKAYMNEEAEMLKATKLSDTNQPILANNLPSSTSNGQTEPETIVKEQLDGSNKGENEKSDELQTREGITQEVVSLKFEEENDLGQSCPQVCSESVIPSVFVETETSINVFVSNENAMFESSEQNLTFSCDNGSPKSTRGLEVVKPPTFVSDLHMPEPLHDCEAATSSNLAKIAANSDSFSEREQDGDATEVIGSNVNASEPIYEGEDCILESEARTFEDREPLYEGEVVLAKQGDISTKDSSETNLTDQFSRRQGELIRNFLKNSASQLTINGLFCLQDGLKERELCVFFRNNHFNTMFKFEGELYILATDQGYLNQPDLVWEKLNEVNGDTVFMTGSFKEFNVENHDSSSWNESNAVASTTDFIASIDNAANSGSSFNSDLQLAIALQQQEFEHQQSQRNLQQQKQQQQQQQQQQLRQQQPVTTSSRLHVGPQAPRQSGNNSAVSSRQEAKSVKDKCKIM